MAPKDGDPAPNAASSAAFAATVAPTSSQSPTPPLKLPDGTLAADGALGDSALEKTVAAPASREPGDAASRIEPLPEVSASLYATEREIARGGMGKIVAAEDR